ncbi:induced myeloid leukemia cell differentiation protein Mcl-1 [Varanus komodoensis]|uniref:induced myeloid leukemia cell differentiation protein Mcl-1 n=1 Tax=Varanus komodoensis TaxID=61221 RepID=UPI001CF7BE6F|nr:induced myeloid leukemia cell differentiation protein Mcl-1 [Varanus komodoensis]
MAAMLNTKAMVLYCGSAPASPPGAPRLPEPARACPRPAALPLPEGELDGCEPDAEGSGGGLVPSPTPSVASSQEGEPEPAAADDGGGALGLRCHDDLRKVTLEVVGRYLREAASQGPAEGGGGAGKFLQGLVGRFGAPQGGAGAACADQALETLRRVGGGILDKHQLAFQGMLKKMEIKKEDDLKSVSEIASHVFSDGVTNWGRIVTLIAFGAFVAKHLKNINQESGISTLTEIITDVLVTDKREWLVNHNAWEGFVKFFHVEDIEGSIRNVLMTFAGVAGLGASLAYMIR